MDTSSLKLNDFESFENFLFTEEERKKPENEKWAKYIITENTSGIDKNYFVAPIPLSKLGEIEEYQLCHYAYWTCIAIFNPTSKINFFKMNNITPASRCYACAYAHTHHIDCTVCPLQNHTYACIPPHVE